MLDQSDSEGDNEVDTVSPVLDEFVSHGGNRIYKAMSPFTKQEFESLWDMIHVDFSSAWSGGRGPQSKTKPKDAFFMTLCVTHLPIKWDNHGAIFRASGQTSEKTVWKTL